MSLYKKSLGQNFLIDKNIIKKILKIVNIEDRNIIEIGPGNGSLTDQILNLKPKSVLTIEKDNKLSLDLEKKYKNYRIFKNLNADVLKLDIEKFKVKNPIIFGNLPYNISSQILVKFLKFKSWPPNYSDMIFMFQKELGEKILGKFSSKKYGRISILTNYRLFSLNKFDVSPNCFFPKPKVNSTVIHFKPKEAIKPFLNNLSNLEKVTNILFSNKRKMIKKNIFKILKKDEIKKIDNLDLKLRPSKIKPEIYYKIAKLYEMR